MKRFKMIYCFIFIFSSNIYSQTEDVKKGRIAEKLYHEKYSKLSFVIQPSKITSFSAYNTNGATDYPSIKFNDSRSIQFGVYYNFAQSGNFNFKTGLIAKEFNPLFDLNVSDEDIGYGTGYDLTGFDFLNSFIFSIPVKAEYFLKVNENFNIVAGAGLSLDIFTGGGETVTGVSVHSETEGKDIFRAETHQEQRTVSAEISLGANYQTKFALFQLEVLYNKNILDVAATGSYHIYNLEVSDDRQGVFVIDGNFYGLSLSISPKKGWLKKKSNQ